MRCAAELVHRGGGQLNWCCQRSLNIRAGPSVGSSATRPPPPRAATSIASAGPMTVATHGRTPPPPPPVMMYTSRQCRVRSWHQRSKRAQKSRLNPSPTCKACARAGRQARNQQTGGQSLVQTSADQRRPVQTSTDQYRPAQTRRPDRASRAVGGKGWVQEPRPYTVDSPSK